MPHVLIDKDSLVFNFQLLRQKSPSGVLFPVLKADAYGHGAPLVAGILSKKFSSAHCPLFCVARLGEALEILKFVKTRDILLLSENLETLKDCLHVSAFKKLVWVVSDFSDFHYLLKVKVPVRFHLNVNTGMNRLGVTLEECRSLEFRKTLEKVFLLGHKCEGIMSHLSDGEQDPAVASEAQVNRFSEIVEYFRQTWKSYRLGKFPRWIHIANSGGSFWRAGSEFCTAIRPGLHLYGVCAESSPTFKRLGLKPVMSLFAPLRKVLSLKVGDRVGYGGTYVCKTEKKLGVIELGYADGLDRKLSGSKKVGFYFSGRFCPIVGRVSMDLCHVDLTPVYRQIEPFVGLPGRAMFEWMGPHQSVEQLAEAKTTIPYEILTSIGHRLPRLVGSKKIYRTDKE